VWYSFVLVAYLLILSIIVINKSIFMLLAMSAGCLDVQFKA